MAALGAGGPCSLFHSFSQSANTVLGALGYGADPAFGPALQGFLIWQKTCVPLCMRNSFSDQRQVYRGTQRPPTDTQAVTTTYTLTYTRRDIHIMVHTLSQPHTHTHPTITHTRTAASTPVPPSPSPLQHREK